MNGILRTLVLLAVSFVLTSALFLATTKALYDDAVGPIGSAIRAAHTIPPVRGAPV